MSVMYRTTTFKTGLTIATATMPHMSSVTVGIWVGVGGRHEPLELNGVSHFIEHLLFKGTRKRTAKQISQEIEGLGGYLNAFTSEENTCYYSKAGHDRWRELLTVLLDMYLNSKFDPGEIAKERSVIKEELAMYLDQPQQLVQELLNANLWPNHPLGRSITGTVKTLDAVSRNDLIQFQRTNYIAGRTIIAAAGKINHRELSQFVEKFISKIPTGTAHPAVPVGNDRAKSKIKLLTKKVEQSQIAIGFHTCSRHDDQRFSLRLLNTIMGENMSSRLFQTIREDHGLAYSIYSSLCFFEDDGSFNIFAGLDTKNISTTLKLISIEINRIKNKSPSVSEFRRARDYVLGQIDLSLESTENQMMWLGEQLLAEGKFTPPNVIKDKLSRVKRADLPRVARKYLTLDQLNMAIISPLKTTRGLMKNLTL